MAARAASATICSRRLLKIGWPPVDDEAAPDGVVAAREDDWDRRSRSFRREWRNDTAACCDQIDLATDEIGSQCGQSIIAALCPAVFDRQILPLDIAGPRPVP